MAEQRPDNGRELFDVDDLGIDGFRYSPDWSLGHIANRLFGNRTIARVNVAAPLGTEFAIYLVSGWSPDGVPHLDLTLSAGIARGLSEQLTDSKTSALWNSSLWLRDTDSRTVAALAQSPESEFVAARALAHAIDEATRQKARAKRRSQK